MDTSVIIGILIGLVLAIIFIAISIPEFKKLKETKDRQEKEEGVNSLKKD